MRSRAAVDGLAALREDPTPTRENKGSAIFCASAAGARRYIAAPQQARSVGHARRRERREPRSSFETRMAGIDREPIEHGGGQLGARGRRHQPRRQLHERRARRERPAPPAQPASRRARRDARRPHAAPRASRRAITSARDDHDRPDVHAPAQEPHRRRRRAMAASVAAAAKAESATEHLAAARQHPAARLARVVPAVQRTAAVAARLLRRALARSPRRSPSAPQKTRIPSSIGSNIVHLRFWTTRRRAPRNDFEQVF